MTEKEQIRVEIERQRSLIEGLFIEGDNSFYDGQDDAYNHLLAFIDSLPDENNPEPYNPVYDEDYLNEKIAKATKSWEGVDVDAMLAECRGYEEKPSEDLEEAARLYAIPHYMKDIDVNYIEEYPYDTGLEAAFIAGAEWQEKQDLRWAGEIHKNGYNLCKEQMMKDAMEIEVGMHGEPIQITLDKYVQRAKNIFPGEKVKLLIVKE